MSNIGFRDSSIVIIESGRTFIRAGLGLHDLIHAPSIEIPARVGIRPSADLQNDNLDVQPSASTSRAASSVPQSQPISAVRVTDYLVGKQLDEAIEAGQDLIISWPFAEGEIRDWIQVEALWKYVLFTSLQLRRVQFESPVLLCLYPGLSRDAFERIAQVFFERFNVAAFSILDRPMAQLYAANTISGVAVDINDTYTDVTPVYEGFPIHYARTSILLGTHDCERFLAHLLRSNTSVMSSLSPPDAPLEGAALDETLRALARQVWQEGLVKVPSDGEGAREVEDEGVTDIAAVLVAGKEKAVIESGMKKRATAKASAAEQARAREIEALDLVTVQFRGKELTLGKERHRFCEPLFDPNLLTPIEGAEELQRRAKEGLFMPLHQAVGHAVGQAEVDIRQYIYGGLLVTGDIASHVKGIGPALQSRLSPYILSSPDQANDVQPRSVRLVKVAEYFAEYREKGDGLAAFLGSSIVAKITFHDPNGKNFVSKADYSERGPKAVLEMSPCLL
ncbi:actin-like ATPase domain-containing protein [Dentipellis sp. KUC8613]|nr:actin-like ATPase domain-containing protein [Dentipellis sp. KUC8613]